MGRTRAADQATGDVWPITLTVTVTWLLLNRLFAEMLARLEFDFARPVVGPLA